MTTEINPGEYPHTIRETFYRYAISKIRERDGDVAVALCKETPEMLDALGTLVDTTKCNCLP